MRDADCASARAEPQASVSEAARRYEPRRFSPRRRNPAHVASCPGKYLPHYRKLGSRSHLKVRLSARRSAQGRRKAGGETGGGPGGETAGSGEARREGERAGSGSVRGKRGGAASAERNRVVPRSSETQTNVSRETFDRETHPCKTPHHAAPCTEHRVRHAA